MLIAIHFTVRTETELSANKNWC